MTRRFSLTCVLALGLLTALAHGQDASEQSEEQRPPVFRTGTELVRVDVSVLDRGGKPIRSLTADDFELRENGQLQAITSFRLVEADGEPTDDLSLPIRSTHHAAVEAARDDVRVFLIFWDEYHIEQFSSAMRARDQLTRFVLEAFGPTDLVGIMDQLTPMSAVRFTRDRRALADTVHQLRGRRGVYIPTRSGIEDAHLRNAQDVERIRGQVTATALRSAVMHLGTLRQGRKAVIFVSESLGRLGQDGPRVVSDLVRTANDNNTAIYTVDPRGLQASGGAGFAGMSSLLAALADATGAEPIVSNDISGALRRVVSHASAFYLIGYAPTDSQPDGKFREIDVRVRQPGVQVRARNGYWAPRASELERARAIAMAAASPSPVALALRELPPDNSRRSADFWIGQSPSPGEEGVDVSIAWAPRQALDERLTAASVTLSATTKFETLFEGPVEAGGVSFTAPPGTVDLDITIHDDTGEVVDREQREVEITDPGQTVLALTTPVVSRAQNPAEFRELTSQTSPAAYAGREFSRTDRLLVRGFAYGADAAGVTVTAQLVGPRGSTLAELPIRMSGNPGAYVLDLPLTSLATGEFLIAIAARTSSEHVEALVPLRIRR